MNRIVAIDFICLGILLIGFSLLVNYFLSNVSSAILLTGILGGTICLIWDIVAYRGYQKKWWLVLSLVLISYIFLSQAVTAWIQPVENTSRFLAIGTTLMLIFTIGSLMNLFHGQGCISTNENSRQ